MSGRRETVTAWGRPVLGGGFGPDAATVLTIYVLCLLVIPSPMTFKAMGQIGGPATLMALACFVWWAWDRVHRADDLPRHEPRRWVRTTALLYLVVVILAYTHSAGLSIPAVERSSADAGLIRTFGWVGLICVAVDGLLTRERLWSVVRGLAWVMGAICLLTVVQILTGQIWVDRLSIPGLSSPEGLEMMQRGSVLRPSGTSTHPIELSAVLAMSMPVVIAVAAREKRHPWLMRGISLLLPVVLLLSGSRTAMVCGAVAFMILMAAFSPQARLLAGGVLAMVLVAVYLTMPGFIGSLTSLFAGAGNDPSVASRTDSYAMVLEFWSHHVWLGRGVGTFLPGYWILDNQYLTLLLGGGVLALLAQLMVFLSAIGSGIVAARLATDHHDRMLAVALVAGVSAGAVSWALFDAAAFAQAAGIMFVLAGLCGAVLRVAQAQRDLVTAAPAPAPALQDEDAAGA